MQESIQSEPAPQSRHESQHRQQEPQRQGQRRGQQGRQGQSQRAPQSGQQGGRAQGGQPQQARPQGGRQNQPRQGQGRQDQPRRGPRVERKELTASQVLRLANAQKPYSTGGGLNSLRPKVDPKTVRQGMEEEGRGNLPRKDVDRDEKW